MVFDMIANAPGVLNSTLQWGRLQDVGGGGRRSQPDPRAEPDRYDFKPPKVYSWNVGVQHKVWHAITLDLAYVGSKSKDLLRQSQINALPLRRRLPAPEPGPDPRRRARRRGRRRCPPTCCAPTRATAASACGTTAATATTTRSRPAINRRFDNGFMFSAFYVWSKALTIANDRLHRGPPERERRGDQAGRLLVRGLRPPAQLRAQLRLPDAQGRERRARRPGERLADLGHLPLDERPAVRHQLLDPGHRQHEPHRHAPTSAPASWSRATRAAARAAIPTSRSTPRASPRRSPAATATSRPGSSCWAPPIVNLDMSLSKVFPVGKRVKLEVRLDAFNALNHTQFTGVNNTANFASLTDPTITNLPYDASGNLDPQQRVREHQRGRSAADAPARHPPDVLGGSTGHLGPAPRRGAGPSSFAGPAFDPEAGLYNHDPAAFYRRGNLPAEGAGKGRLRQEA